MGKVDCSRLQLFPTIRSLFSLLLVLLLVSGCSSSDSVDNNPSNESGNAPVSEETDPTASDDSNLSPVESAADSTTEPAEGPVPDTTRVTFDITVPVYVSNALQLRIQWGEKDLLAAWVVDETWAITDDFPTDTENRLVVTFADDNGGTPLGIFETDYQTGTSTTETFEITADQFDTERWDSDGDGVGNIDESLDGTTSQGGDAPERVQASLELVPDKTYRITWQPSQRAEFYRVLVNPDGISGYTQISDDLDRSTHEFDHRVALYRMMNASYVVQSCNANVCSDSDALQVSGTLEQAIGYVKAGNSGSGDRFGVAISLSDDGNTMAVSASSEDSSAAGVNGEQEDDSLSDSGAVYLFRRLAGEWIQSAYLKASNPDQSDFFGNDLSLSADGTVLAVGARSEAGGSQQINGDQLDNSVNGSGAIYLFELIENQWIQTHYIKASIGSSLGYFGRHVKLSGDGNTLVTGGNRTTNGPHDVVYIFDRAGSTWQETIIESSFQSLIFGAEGLALSADGNTLVIGDARFFQDTIGSAHVYTRAENGWSLQASLVADNADVGDGFGFGRSLSISADGDTLAIGAQHEAGASTGVNNRDEFNENSSYRAGGVYIFKRNAATWQQQAFIKASNTDARDKFGVVVSLNSEGDGLAVGAYMEQSASIGINGDETDNSTQSTLIHQNGSGAAYFFSLKDGLWNQTAYIKSKNTDQFDAFGRYLALSGDGNTLAIGATDEGSSARGLNGDSSDNSAEFSGAVYIY